MKKERKDKNFIKKPVYPGGPAAMRAFIKQNLKYPPEAVEKGIEGTVSLKYTIDHKGNVSDAHVISGLGYGCDEEAKRLVRLFKFEVPKTRGVKVQFHKDMHVHFRLPKKKAVPPQQFVPQYTYTPAKKPAAPAKQPGSSVSYTITITTRKSQ